MKYGIMQKVHAESTMCAVRSAIRANAVPMVVLWMFAGFWVVGYFCMPQIQSLFEPFRQWQVDYGWKAAFLSRLFFCGVVPCVFLLSVKRIRPRKPILTACAQALWCGLWGVAGDFFFRLQDAMFGGGREAMTLICKTAVDQFVWTVFVIAPTHSAFFFWAGRDFSFNRAIEEWPSDFITRFYLPNLIANWVVWIPAQCAVYAFPLLLQVHLAGLVGSFWMLVSLHLGARSVRHDAIAYSPASAASG